MYKNPIWLQLFEKDGNISLSPSEEPRINAAVSDFIDSGWSRDKLLDLSLLSGQIYYTRASNIFSWLISTPEHRREEAEHKAAWDTESRELKMEFGAWEEKM